MSARNSLTATNLAVHQHFNCDLYLYNTYHASSNPKAPTSDTSSPSELTKAQYKRGLDWESRLYSWLDATGLLLQVPSLHLDPDTLLENIFADDRSHFFITGLTFWPPQAQLNERFRQEGSAPLNFGLAKPDLLEIMRTDEGIMWRVLDVKASKNVKTSHHMQIYFYTLCLRYLLGPPFYHSAESTGIWLPAKEGGLPSLNDIKYISLELLAQPFDHVIFRELPKMLGQTRQQVKWHYNPVCSGCPFESDCRRNAQDEGRFGAMANISINDMIALKDLLRISRGGSFRELPITDIEELHDLIKDRPKLEAIAHASPSVVKRARQILALPKKIHPTVVVNSPIVEAARTREIQVINRRNYTCPRREDIAIFISIVIDPSTANTGGNTFCVTLHSQNPNIPLPSSILANSNNFVPSLAQLIRTIATLHPSNHRGYTTQFYVWSAAEHHALQSHIINAALTSTHDVADIQLCVGALSQGAALLQTAFQPLLLSGALLSFLGKGKRLKAEYVACAKRLGLPTDGTAEVIRKRIDAEVRRVQEEAAREAESSEAGERRRRQFGQLPRVVVLKKEIERQLALPVPGYWDLPECVGTLLPHMRGCPTDEEIYVASRASSENHHQLEDLLTRRNKFMYAVLMDFRASAVAASGHSLLINEGAVLSTNFMDICKQPHIRKLFFMQQFEVLAKLTEAWQTRIEGCPDAPTLEYVKSAPGAQGQQHVFRLLSGTVDVPSADRDYAFFDKLLVRDTADLPNGEHECDRLSAEALFDDLAVSGLLFPLNQWTRSSWYKQDPRVQKEVTLADVRTVYTDQERLHTMVSLRTWGAGNVPLQVGATYRLSPRLVDFNTTKILSALFEIDLTWGSVDEGFADGPHPDDHHDVPFLQLIMDPTSLGKLADSRDFVKTESEIQKLFRDLKGLGNDIAGSLVLKPSQHRAAQRILSNRLSVVWGPPGTGKTYTITLSLLRLLEVERRYLGARPKIVMITAITHAAVEACHSKLTKLMDAYKSIDALPTKWLEDVKLEVVSRGSEHPAPKKSGNTMYIYAGTIYQLSNFMKRHSMEVDCVIIDEAGQISLGAVSIVLRSLAANGRIVIAGDSEQLAPILSAQYPQLTDYSLFGSVLDCLMFSQSQSKAEHAWPISQASDKDEEPMSQGTVIQLTENFRLNPDLGEFVSTIYSRQFKPQKTQARELGRALSSAIYQEDVGRGINTVIVGAIQTFLVSLSDVMLKQPQTVLMSPEISSTIPAELLAGTTSSALVHRPVSLAMIRLKTLSGLTQQLPYETHVHGEAAVAAALVDCIRTCCPHDDIFVATPHRIQREAVKAALDRVKSRTDSPSLEEDFADMTLGGTSTKPKVIVDTIERLQGSEASFVVCLFSLTRTHASDLPFLLERRRLNVAISRAKTLCILVTSDEVLRPGVRILADEDTAKGYAFLRAFEKRAWSYNLSVNVDTLS